MRDKLIRIWLSGGNLYLYTAMASLLAFANTYLISHSVSPSQYAAYATSNWMIGAVFTFSALGLPLLIRNYYRDPVKVDIIKKALRCGLALSLALSLCAFYLYGVYGSKNVFELHWVLYISISSIVLILLSFVTTSYQVNNDFRMMGRVTVIRPLLIFLFAILFVLGDGKLSLSLSEVLSISASLMLLVVIKFYRAARKIFVEPNRKISYLFTFKTTVPLVLHGAVSFIAINIDRFILPFYFDAADVGKYFLVFQYAMLLSILIDVATKIYQNKIYNLLDEKKVTRRGYLIVGCKLVLILIILCFPIISLYEIGLLVVLPQEFIKEPGFVNWLIFGLLSSVVYLYFSQPLFYYENYRLVPTMSIISLCSGIVGFFLLNYYRGASLNNVAFSYFIGQFSLAIMSLVYCIRVLYEESKCDDPTQSC